jgi:hypothetical protein
MFLSSRTYMNPLHILHMFLSSRTLQDILVFGFSMFVRRRSSDDLNSWGLIPGRNKIFLFVQTGFAPPPQSPVQWAPGAIFPGGKEAGALTTHLHLVPRSRKVELYLHSPMCSWHNAELIKRRDKFSCFCVYVEVFEVAPDVGEMRFERQTCCIYKELCDRLLFRL